MIPNWIFDDRAYFELSEEAKLLLPYLIAGPGSGRSKHLLPPGIFHSPFRRIAADHYWELEDLRTILNELVEVGWISTDEENDLIFVPSVVTQADNPSHLIGTLRKLNKVPNSLLRQKYFELVLTLTVRQNRNWKTSPLDQKEVLNELPEGLDLSFISKIKSDTGKPGTEDG